VNKKAQGKATPKPACARTTAKSTVLQPSTIWLPACARSLYGQSFNGGSRGRCDKTSPVGTAVAGAGGSPQHPFSRSRRGRPRLATRTKWRKGLNGAGSAVAAQALILRGGR